jgi:hypothetical protein
MVGCASGSGAGREAVEAEVSNGMPSPEVTRQPWGVISTNSPSDVAAGGIAGGEGFDVAEDGGEGVGGGDGFVGGERLGEEPVAEGRGANGEGEEAGRVGGDGEEGASADGAESGAALGDAEEGVEGRGSAGFGWDVHLRFGYSTGAEGSPICGEGGG